MDYSSVCYNNSCLSQVIIRVDFLEFIENDDLFSSTLEKEIRQFFQQKSMPKVIRYQTMNVIKDHNGTRAEHTTQEGIQQEYSNDENNKIIISNKFIILEINKYSTYENMIKMFTPIIKSITEQHQVTSTRTGIRYINFFNEEGIKPQKNFFISSIGALLETKQSVRDCTRAMAMSEYIIDDMHLNFRYGMYNPQYPQVIKKPSFVLDYDCYIEGAISGYDTIMNHIQKGHDNIQLIFEDSITSQLRKVMK